MKRRIFKWLAATWLASDQFFNALTGGNPNETISMRAALAREHGSKVGRGVCAVLEALDHDHCLDAIKHGKERTAKVAAK